jgi:hypothetical protein
MGDIVCPVCHEPLDGYTFWHWRDELGSDEKTARGIALLKAGRGCPSCMGKNPYPDETDVDKADAWADWADSMDYETEGRLPF